MKKNIKREYCLALTGAEIKYIDNKLKSIINSFNEITKPYLQSENNDNIINLITDFKHYDIEEEMTDNDCEEYYHIAVDSEEHLKYYLDILRHAYNNINVLVNITSLEVQNKQIKKITLDIDNKTVLITYKDFQFIYRIYDGLNISALKYDDNMFSMFQTIIRDLENEVNELNKELIYHDSFVEENKKAVQKYERHYKREKSEASETNGVLDYIVIAIAIIIGIGMIILPLWLFFVSAVTPSDTDTNTESSSYIEETSQNIEIPGEEDPVESVTSNESEPIHNDDVNTVDADTSALQFAFTLVKLVAQIVSFMGVFLTLHGIWSLVMAILHDADEEGQVNAIKNVIIGVAVMVIPKITSVIATALL